ncbi:MAG: flagellar type III secretion system pore protein FliP [Hyphomicrobium sp.]
MFLATPYEALAQSFDLRSVLPAGDASVAGRILQMMVLVTVLSVAPGILMMVTSFTRFIIALSFLRVGLGLQTTPGNLVLVSLALFMTMFVMAPTFEIAWTNGVKPMIDNKITPEAGYSETTAPFRSFMLANVRDKDLTTFKSLSKARFNVEAGLPDDDLRVLVPAFMISELRRGFEIGFLIVLPFLVIDLVVATVLMSMGMMMLPPTVISMPLKILFFVLIDGWGLLVGTLAKSFV